MTDQLMATARLCAWRLCTNGQPAEARPLIQVLQGAVGNPYHPYFPVGTARVRWRRS